MQDRQDEYFKDFMIKDGLSIELTLYASYIKKKTMYKNNIRKPQQKLYFIRSMRHAAACVITSQVLCAKINRI